ncbi:MAG: hypothetical protein FIA92_05390 [Chloroflexi bacterium]|nr:hypothetical protein [Chloroflexota bacterium]
MTTTDDAETMKRRGVVDRIFETLGNGLGGGIGWLAESGVLFVIFAVVWVAFGAGLVLSQGSIDQAWQAIRELPILVQAVVWVLFLPVMIGLWVWESSWPLIVRLVEVVGVAGWNLWMFLPKALQPR